MSETGASEAFPPRPGYQPRHEAAGQPAAEPDVGLLATIAAAVQIYLLRNGEGVQNATRATEEYHGRHRAEDRGQETTPASEGPPPEPEESGPNTANAEEVPQEEATPIFDRLRMAWGSQATLQAGNAPPPRPGARLAHAITAQNLLPESSPQPEVDTPNDATVVQTEPERPKGLIGRMRHAWYAGMAAITAYFANPEKGRRRRILATSTAVLGGVAATGALLWTSGRMPDWPDNPSPDWTPYVAPPAKAPQGTEQLCDAFTPYAYHGEQYEWTAAANTYGSVLATPWLQDLIHAARDNGLVVDTWGSVDCGQWGVTSVTASLPDGTEKTYYDTASKLALLQRYAAGSALPPA